MAPVLVRTGRTLCPLPIEDHQRSRLLVCCVFQRPAQPQKPSVDAGWTLAFLVIYQRPMFLVSRLYIYIYSISLGLTRLMHRRPLPVWCFSHSRPSLVEIHYSFLVAFRARARSHTWQTWQSVHWWTTFCTLATQCLAQFQDQVATRDF